MYQIIVYLNIQFKLNNGNQEKSQPHSSEPLIPPNRERQESNKGEKKTLHPRENHRVPCTPQETPQPTINGTQDATAPSIRHPTIPWAPTPSS